MIKNKKKINLALIIAGIFLLIGLTHIELLGSLWNSLWTLLLPIVIGFVLAFILDVPVVGFENLFAKLTAKAKKKPKVKTIHTVSMVLSIVCVLLVLTLLFTLVIPELVRTVKTLAAYVKDNWPKLISFLEQQNIDTTRINEWLAGFDIEGALKNIMEGAGTVLGSVASAASTTASTIFSSVIGVIIAVYVLSSRDTLKRQAKKVLYAYLKPEKADRACYIGRLTKDSFAKFLTGQCLEAIILGILIFISFTIFQLPYAPLLGVVTAICALIPYVGAFISCALGVLLALLESPQKAIICLVVYLVVQFIETQFIYPYVVGGSVGLSPLWTLIAVLIGGNLFGLMGMIFFIPVVSVIYTLVKEDTDKRLEIKKKETEKQV